MHIRYKPRINLGSLGVTRESMFDYAARYARLQPTITSTPTTTISPSGEGFVAPVTNKISPPASFYEQAPIIQPVSSGEVSLTPPPGYIGTMIMPPPGSVWGYSTDSVTGVTSRVAVDPVTLTLSTSRYEAIPEPFRYSKEQIMDMLARGASETFERTGETDSGLPIEMELEQISRELDATKQYAIDADGTIIPTEPSIAPGAGVGWLAAAVVGFLLFGG